MKGYRFTVGLAVLALTLTACGARLTDEQRDFAISGATGGAAGTGGGDVGGGTAAGPGGDTAGGTSGIDDGGTAGGTGSGGGTDGGTTTGGSDTGGATDGSGTGGATDGGGTDGGTDTGADGTTPDEGGGQTTTDTRAAPPGGNGGATDVGVTEDKIVVANVADISGAVPGLFEDAQKAVQAYFAYFAASEGTVYGRQIELLALDSKITDGGNREQYLRACDDAFAAVGSMSAADGGASGPVEDCGIPDLRSAAVNAALQVVDSVYGVDAMKPGLLPTTEYNYWAEQHPDAIKKAAYLWIDNDTTQYQTEQNRAGTEKIGYEWVYERAIDIAETNYSSFVIDMRNEGVEFVTIQGAVTQATRLADAMQQQGFEPAVYALQTNLYTPDLIAQGGNAIEGAQLAVTGSLLEEIGSNPEMQTYAQWLQQIDPDARPTGLGMYAWSAARLFVQLIKEIGPELTREKLLSAIADVHAYEGNGLIPAQDIGNKQPADCIIIVEVQGGEFVRVEPSSGFRCDNKVVSTE